MKVRRGLVAAAGVALLFGLVACDSAGPPVMPNVVGQQLDLAKSDIDRAGYSRDVEIIGGGLFGVLDDSNWVVCEQEPSAGEPIADPRLVVDRECAPENVPTAEPVESADPTQPTEIANAVDTTVDELLDRLNSVDMGGILVGDQFRFTGELVRSDLWYTGRTGDYVVLFTAHGGADDLMVLVDESEAIGWTDGTRLDVTVENVEITLDGETTDGWLRLVAATLAG